MLPIAVLAGGLGTRLRAVTGELVPKVMVPVLGRPFIDYKLLGLASAGVERVVLLIGHQGPVIRDWVGTGDRYGLRVSYVEDGPELRGTGGALQNALAALPDAFWVTYGDTLLEVPLQDAEEAFVAADCSALMTVLHNYDAFEPSNVAIEAGRVAAYGKNPRPRGADYIDYGMLAFRRSAFDAFGSSQDFDLGDLLVSLVASGSVVAYEVTERFHEVGTLGALRETEEFLRGRG